MESNVHAQKAILGLIAGSGFLPALVIEVCQATRRPLFVLALQGCTNPVIVRNVSHAWVHLGAVSHGLRVLRRAGVSELVLAGAVYRPSMQELRPDWRTLALFTRIGLKVLGDNALLKAVIEELEAEGFQVVKVEDVIGEITAPAGLYAGPIPDAQAWADIWRGVEVSRALGALDVGQAAVVQQGLVLAVEGVEGTDAMLERCRVLSRQGPGGVLVKVCKPNQERRADMPTIGTTTISNAAAAGLRGIAVEAGGTLIVGHHRGIAMHADRLGLFVIGVTLDTI